MEIILSKQCESLTGSLGQGFGYHIQSRIDRDGKKRFWGVRKSKGSVPPDGHWKFILACANLAQSKLHIDDIKVPGWEIYLALEDAQCGEPDTISPSKLYNANEVLELKTNLGL